MARRRHRMNPLNPLNPLGNGAMVFGVVVAAGAGVAAGYFWGKKAATPAGTTATVTTPALPATTA